MSHHSRSIRKQMSHNEQEFRERSTLSSTKRPQTDPAEWVNMMTAKWAARAAQRQAALPGVVIAIALWSEAEWYEIVTVITFRKNASQLLILLPFP